MAAPRVLIAEDQVLLREGLARLLEEQGLDVVAQAGDADDLIRKASAHRPDVAIVDVQMPPGGTDDGLRAAIRLRRELPDMGVLVFSQFLDERYPLDLIGDDASGVGYLLKTRVREVEELMDAVGRVAAGGTAFDPEILSALVGGRRGSPLDGLSDRERTVLTRIAEGRSNRAIARQLDLSPRAVERHVQTIFQKLGLPGSEDDNRRVLAVLALLGH
jgi:DNA-binding NarL/FixJ family response regulator